MVRPLPKDLMPWNDGGTVSSTDKGLVALWESGCHMVYDAASNSVSAIPLLDPPRRHVWHNIKCLGGTSAAILRLGHGGDDGAYVLAELVTSVYPGLPDASLYLWRSSSTANQWMRTSVRLPLPAELCGPTSFFHIDMAFAFGDSCGRKFGCPRAEVSSQSSAVNFTLRFVSPAVQLLRWPKSAAAAEPAAGAGAAKAARRRPARRGAQVLQRLLHPMLLLRALRRQAAAAIASGPYCCIGGIPPPWDTTFASDSCVCWADLLAGVLICDLFAPEGPEFSFVPLPQECCLYTPENTRLALRPEEFRSMGVFCGAIKFLAMVGYSEDLPKEEVVLKTWTLSSDFKEWKEGAGMLVRDLWESESFREKELPRGWLKNPVLSMNEDEIIYISLCDVEFVETHDFYEQYTGKDLVLNGHYVLRFDLLRNKVLYSKKSATNSLSLLRPIVLASDFSAYLRHGRKDSRGKEAIEVGTMVKRAKY